MTDSEHILVEDQHGRPRTVCGDNTQYRKDPITGTWTNPRTGETAPFLGEEWDMSIGDLCPNCIILVLTHGDDACELSFWQQKHPGRPTPLEIAETALRNIEIDADVPTPSEPAAAAPATPPQPIPANHTSTPRPPKPPRPPRPNSSPRHKRKYNQRKTDKN